MAGGARGQPGPGPFALGTAAFRGAVAGHRAAAARCRPLCVLGIRDVFFFSFLTSKVNLFTVIFFSELFAIIGCADEGHPLGGDLSVFRELILFKCSPCN